MNRSDRAAARLLIERAVEWHSSGRAVSRNRIEERLDLQIAAMPALKNPRAVRKSVLDALDFKGITW